MKEPWFWWSVSAPAGPLSHSAEGGGGDSGPLLRDDMLLCRRLLGAQRGPPSSGLAPLVCGFFLRASRAEGSWGHTAHPRLPRLVWTVQPAREGWAGGGSPTLGHTGLRAGGWMGDAGGFPLQVEPGFWA